MIRADASEKGHVAMIIHCGVGYRYVAHNRTDRHCIRNKNALDAIAHSNEQDSTDVVDAFNLEIGVRSPTMKEFAGVVDHRGQRTTCSQENTLERVELVSPSKRLGL